jgi:hypothetical protein
MGALDPFSGIGVWLVRHKHPLPVSRVNRVEFIDEVVIVSAQFHYCHDGSETLSELWGTLCLK